MDVYFASWKETNAHRLGFLKSDPDHWLRNENLEDSNEHLRNFFRTFAFAMVLLLGCAIPALQAASLEPPLRSTYFDGDDRVVYPHQPEYGAEPPMSIEAWVFVETNKFMTIVSHNFDKSFYFGLTDSRKMRFYRSGGFPHFADSTDKVPLERWTHLAVTYDGTKATFYLDGLFSGDEVLSHAGGSEIQELWIGNDMNSANLGFQGCIDEIRIWDTARSQTEIVTNRFLEIDSHQNLVVRFAGGGGLPDTINNLDGEAFGVFPKQWGILPRIFIVPDGPAVNDDQSLAEFSASGAERIVWRYLTKFGEQKDVEGFVMYRDVFGDHNLYIAIPVTPNRSEILTSGQDLWFSSIIDTNSIGGAKPHAGVLRFDSHTDNLTPGLATNHLMQGNGIDYSPLASPPQGVNWDVVPLDGCEFDCGRIYRIRDWIFGGFTGTNLALFGEFAYPDPPHPAFSLSSPFDGSPYVPDTWPLLLFTTNPVVLASVKVQGTVQDVTPGGGGGGISGATVYLSNADDGSIFQAKTTPSNGQFSFNTTVYPPGVRLRVNVNLPGGNTWRALTPVVTGNAVSVESVTDIQGNVVYDSCTDPVTCDLGVIQFDAIEYNAPSLSHYDPNRGTPHLVLRTTPLDVTDATRFQLYGTNLHPFTSYYLSHENCNWPLGVGDPLPSGPGCTNFPLVVIDREADWTRVELELDFELLPRLNVPGESFHRGPYRVLCQDTWLGGWLSAGNDFVIHDPYPKVHGFQFLNERDGTQFDEFSNVFRWNAYDCVTPIGPFHGANPCIGCRLPNPAYLGFHSLVFTPWVELMSGSCLGFAATSLQLARRDEMIESFDPTVRYGTGYPHGGLTTNSRGRVYFAPPKPQQHSFRFCDYSEPVNLWAHIHRNQAAQVSSEFFHTMLDQMSGTGLAPAYAFSIDGDPNTVLTNIQNNLSDYVLGFQFSGDIIKAHAVAPYEVRNGFGYDTKTHTMVTQSNSTAIMVYDSNRPEDCNKFIEIDRDRNEYRYFWGFVEEVDGGVTNVVPEYWDGSAIYTIPISMFDNALTMPGADLLVRGLALLLFGAADAAYEDASGGTWGWDATGNFEDTYLGAKAIAPFTTLPPEDQSPEANESRSIFFFPPPNSPPTNILVNVRDKEFGFYAGESGVIAILNVFDTFTGQVDRLWIEPDGVGGPLLGFGFRPGVVRTDFRPILNILTDHTPTTEYEWSGLMAGPDMPLEFRGLRDSAGAELRNLGKDDQVYTVRLARNTENGISTNYYGPITLPGGTGHRVSFTGWPNVTIRSDYDWDLDGDIDISTFITESCHQEPPPPLLTASMTSTGFSIRWPIDCESWVLATTDGATTNTVWSDVPEIPVIVGTTNEVIVSDNPLPMAFFRLRSLTQ